MLIIASALSIQDPRERPTDAQQQADDKHRRFADPDSDFVAYLNLWEYLTERQGELSSSAFRRMCRADFLNYLRVREWQDLQGQLQRLAGDLGVTVSSSSAERSRWHVSLLAGLLSQIGMKTEAPALGNPGSGRRPRAEYLGARNARFAIFPGSGLSRKAPDWIVAAELVETSRLWARTVARIEPEWVEPLARHLVRHSYSEPHWEKKRGGAVALEKVTLYGVPLVVDRKVSYGRIDPVAARELVHQACAGGGRLADQPPVLRREQAAAGRGRGGRAPGPPPRPGGRRGRAVRVLRRADPGGRGLGPALRHLVEAGPPGRPRPAHVQGQRPAPSPRSAPMPIPTSGPRSPPGHPAALLCLRAGQRDGRRHRGHPAEQAQPGERGRVLLAGARAAHRAGHRDDPVAAQGPAA